VLAEETAVLLEIVQGVIIFYHLEIYFHDDYSSLGHKQEP
jgi:hypothetical protein